MSGEDVLETKIVALKEFMENSFAHINHQLDQMAGDMVGLTRFEVWCSRVDKLEIRQDAHDLRLDKLEKANYLLGIIGALAMAVLTAISIAIAMGQLQLVWAGG